MAAVVVEEVGLGQVGQEVHTGPQGQRQPAHPSRQSLILEELQKKRDL